MFKVDICKFETYRRSEEVEEVGGRNSESKEKRPQVKKEKSLLS